MLRNVVIKRLIIELQALDLLTTWFLWKYYNVIEINPWLNIVLLHRPNPFISIMVAKCCITALFCWWVNNRSILWAGVIFYSVFMLLHMIQIIYALIYIR
jgi:hypothetical protein